MTGILLEIFENCIKIPDVNKFLEERGIEKMQTYVLENLEKDDKICSKGFAKAKQEKIHSEGENGMDYKKKIIEMIGKIENQEKGELLYKIASITEILPICECQRIYDYLSELYFS